MRKTTLVAALLATALATGAQAQVCAGFPTVDGGFSLGGRIDFPDEADSFGVEASFNPRGPLSVFGGLNVISVEGVDDDGLDEFFAGVALEVPTLASRLGTRFSVCPQARFQYVDTDLGSFSTIPVGLGIGATLATSPDGPTVSPYVIPQAVFLRFNGDGVGDESETRFGLRGGALVTFGLFFVGGEANFLGGDNSDTTLGIRAGVRF
jgi:hypothetical protein